MREYKNMSRQRINDLMLRKSAKAKKAFIETINKAKGYRYIK